MFIYIYTYIYMIIYVWTCVCLYIYIYTRPNPLLKAAELKASCRFASRKICINLAIFHLLTLLDLFRFVLFQVRPTMAPRLTGKGAKAGRQSRQRRPAMLPRLAGTAAKAGKAKFVVRMLYTQMVGRSRNVLSSMPTWPARSILSVFVSPNGPQGRFCYILQAPMAGKADFVVFCRPKWPRRLNLSYFARPNGRQSRCVIFCMPK